MWSITNPYCNFAALFYLLILNTFDNIELKMIYIYIYKKIF